jgi:large subunit ribosomal protein L25
MSIALSVKKREVFGNRVKSLYRDGLIVGNVFGRGQASVAIEGDYETIRKVVTEAGKNHAIELKIEGEGDHLVLVKNVDVDPSKGRIRHVEMQMVNRNEKVEAEVPIELIGTAPAVLAGNMVMTLNDTVVVSANPTSLPDHLEVSAELLVDPEDMITVANITVPNGVEIMTELDTPLFKVEVPRSQVEEVAEEDTEGEVSAADVPAEHGSEAPATEETNEK